jgi:hypothetical protein
MLFDIYTFGSGSYVVEALQSVKMFMGSNSYSTLARIAGLIALLWVLLAALKGKGGGGTIQADWSWLLFYAFFWVGLIVPKVDVVIIDPIDPPSGASPVVTNVPLGVGALAYITSGIGHGLVQQYETYISIPGDQKYSQNGMLFGANVVRSYGEMEFPDARYSSDMNQFIGHCIFPQITTGTLALDSLATANDLWTYLKDKGQQNRWIEFQDQVTRTCREAADDLNTRMNAQVNTAAGQAGQKLWPTKGVSAAQAAFLASAGGTTATDFIGITQSGADLTRQAMMVKAISGALEGAAVDADNQSMATAVYQAKAETQQRNTYITMGNTAARTLPVMKAVMEAISYAIAPLVFLFVLMPGGVGALGQYAMFMVWLQMWPILYAIINSVMYWYGHQSSLNSALLSDGSYGLTLESMNSVFSVNADMVALAGYMAVSIPMISYMLLKGGMNAGGSVYSSLMQPANSAASASATEQTNGAMTMNTLTMDQASWGNMSANKMDTNRSMSWGMTSVTDANTGATHTSLGSSGNVATNMSQGISSYAFGSQLSNKVAEGLATKAESSMQAAQSDSVEALKASGSAYNSMQSYSNELQKSIANGSADKTEQSSQLQTALANTTNAQQQLATSLGTDVSTAASILGAASAGLKGLPVNLSAGVDAKGVAKASENWQAVEQFVKDTKYSENLSTATSLAHTLSSTQQEGISDKTAATVQASISESASLSNKAAASRQAAESYAVAASHAQEVSMTTGGDISNEVQDRLGIDRMKFTDAQSQAANGDAQARQQISSWGQQYVDSFGKDAGFKGAPTADKVGAKWDSGSGAVTQYGNDQIGRHDAVNQEQLNAHKAEAGLPTRGEIEADAAARQQGVNNGMNADQARVAAGGDSVEGKWQDKGSDIEDKATRSTTGVVVDEAKELGGEAAGVVAENPKALIPPTPMTTPLLVTNAVVSAATGKDYLNEALTPAADAAAKLNSALAAPPRERFTDSSGGDQKKSPMSSSQSQVMETSRGKEISYPNGETRIGGSRSWRNNNPGNLEYGNFAKSHGAIGTDGRFAVFPDKQTGDEARMALLRGKYGNHSIEGMVAAYAPPHENDTGRYASVISSAADVPSSTRISELSDGQFAKMVNKMAQHEGWKEGIVEHR